MVKKINVMGLGWSGSSAIIDFLYDNGLIVGVSGDYPHESLIRNKQSPLKFLNVILSKSYIDKEGILSIMTFGRYPSHKSDLKNQIDGFFDVSEKNKIARNNMKSNHKNFQSLEFNQIQDTVIKILGDKKYYDVQYVIDNYNIIINELFDLINIKHDLILCTNQDPNFKNHSINNDIHEIPNILVYRNPSDMLADRLNKRTSSFLSRQKHFWKFLVLNRLQFSKMLKYLKREYSNIFFISFEDFVEKDTEKRKLLNFLDADISNLNSSNSSQKRFNAEASQENIGLYKINLNFFEKFILYFFLNAKYKKLLKRVKR